MEAAATEVLGAETVVHDGPRVVLGTILIVVLEITEATIVIRSGVIPSVGVLAVVGVVAAASPLTRRHRSCRGRCWRLR
jgi:hypothetical protein